MSLKLAQKKIKKKKKIAMRFFHLIILLCGPRLSLLRGCIEIVKLL